MNRLLTTLLILLPGLCLAQQPGFESGGLSFRPQPESNARGAYPQPQGKARSQSWSTENPDGSRSFHIERNWSYGNPPANSDQQQPTQKSYGYPYGPVQPPAGYPPSQGAPYGQPRQQPWAGGGNPYGQPRQQPSWPGGGYGMPPQPGWQPQPHYQQPQQSQGGNNVRLEAKLAETSAYVHQNLVLSLEVISDSNLSTVSLDLPQTETVVLRELGEASADYRTTSGQREIVNRLHYQLTPMQTGEIEIPALSVSGKMENGRDYQASTGKPIRLTVQPANPGVRPWLPLKSLELSARLLNDDKVAEGQPITLVVEQTAEGMTGAQLPSLESRLRTKHHRIYREKTETDGRISTDGKLIGKRTDHFTLVPQKGNRVEIPAVKVDWWNTNKKRKETAIIPGRLIGSGELIGNLSESFADMPFAGAKGWGFWLPLILIAFVLGFFWRWLWARGRGVTKHVGAWAGVVFHPLTIRLKQLSEKLSPRRQLHRLRSLFANALPRSSRLWYCVRAADQENDPDDWAQVLRFLLNRRLGISAQRPMSQLAEQIISLHRPSQPNEVRKLMRELEAGLFSDNGGVPDFNGWKRRFKQQIRPNPLRFLRFSFGRAPNRLPELNPQI